MYTKLTAALVGAASFFAASAHAQSYPEFSYEGELEIESENLFKSDDPTRELSDTKARLEVTGAAQFNETFGAFTTIASETLTDPFEDRVFEDQGIYVKELALTFGFADTVVSAGKVTPVFGSAFDVTYGFFAGSLAEDYELVEQIGILGSTDLGAGGVLDYGLFYADDTVLSESLGHKRPRNTTADGGAGNTGKLNNGALQWSKTFNDSTTVALGARYLSAGEGDFDDEKGFVATVAHSFDGIPLDAYAEYAYLENFEGTADDAQYLTLNAGYAIGNLTISGVLARRDVTSQGVTDLASIAAEYEFNDYVTVGGAYAFVDEAGIDDQIFGINVVFAFGS